MHKITNDGDYDCQNYKDSLTIFTNIYPNSHVLAYL